tara:strand:+ start:129 stop:302 length:174 start_codon:yes stop_codon:yes gene_type:complete
MRLKNGKVIQLTLSRIISNDIKKMLYKNDPKKYYYYKNYYRRNKIKKIKDYRRSSPW